MCRRSLKCWIIAFFHDMHVQHNIALWDMVIQAYLHFWFLVLSSNPTGPQSLWNQHNRRFFGCGRFKEPPTTGSVRSRQIRQIRLTGMKTDPQSTDVSGYVSGLRTTRQSGHWLRRTDERMDGRTDGRTARQSVVARWPREKTKAAGLCCWRSCCGLCIKSRLLARRRRFFGERSRGDHDPVKRGRCFALSHTVFSGFVE
jgi:hypothetical protein